MIKHKIELDIVGYVRHEYKRINRHIDRGIKNKDYLIRHLSDEDCFSIVDKFLGWFSKAVKHFDHNDYTGAMVTYKINRK